MNSSDAFQERLEVAEECLEFMAKTLESAKDNMENTKKVMGDKNTNVEDIKITIEANARTVEALKRTLEAMRISVEGDFKTFDEVENSLEFLKTTVRCGRKTVRNGEKIVEGETSYVEVEEKNVVFKEGIDETAICDKISEAGKEEETLDAVDRPISAEIQNVEENRKTVEVEEIIKEKTDKSEGKTEKTMEDEQKGLEGWKISGKLEIEENFLETNETIVGDKGIPEITKENSEVVPKEFELAEKKSVQSEENPEILKEEFELAKEKSVRSKEIKFGISKEFELDEEVFVRPEEKTEASKKEFELAWEKYVQPKVKPKEEPELIKEKSVRPKEIKFGIPKEFELAEEVFLRPKEKHEVSKEEFELARDKSVRSKIKPKITKEFELAEEVFVRPKEKPEVSKEEFELGMDKSVRPKLKPKITKEEFELAEEESVESDETIAHIRHTGMDNPMNAMLFSEQLIEYVLNELGCDWPCLEGARNLPKESVSTRFSKVIGETMIAIIDSNIGNIAESYKQLVKNNVHKISAFRTEVCITATFYFYDGYSHDNFLLYAAQLAGLSAFYFASGNTQIADASAQVLAYILNYYIYQLWFLPGSDWFNLHLEAQKLRREIQDGTIKFCMPAGSYHQV